MLRRIFSGIQPTNQIHIGNLIGAIKQWNELQLDKTNNDCIYGVMDLHSMTNANVQNGSISSLAFDCCLQLAACGIDVTECKLYRQSQVKSLD